MDINYNVKFAFVLGLLLWDLRTCLSRAVAGMSTRTVNTRYGQVKGALLEFSDKSLKPVEAYRSLQYATTLGTQMRFMPPTSPSDRWKFIRVAFSYRAVCPQPIIKEDKLLRALPHGEIERRKRIAPFIMSQTEECLNLNLYVPTGRIIIVVKTSVCWQILYNVFTQSNRTDMPEQIV